MKKIFFLFFIFISFLYSDEITYTEVLQSNLGFSASTNCTNTIASLHTADDDPILNVYPESDHDCSQVASDLGIILPDGWVSEKSSKQTTRVVTSYDVDTVNYCALHYDIVQENNCTFHVPCNDEPPEGWLLYPDDGFGGCLAYDSLTISQKEIFATEGAKVCDQCFSAPYDIHNCSSPGILVPNTFPQRCDIDLDNDGISNDIDPDIDGDGITNQNDGFPNDPTKFSMPCDPLENGYEPLNANSTECNSANYIQNNIIYSELVFQSCDGVCYGLPLRFQTCEEVGNIDKSNCDLTKNNFRFVCNPLSDGSISIQSSECIPKENPCTTLENQFKESCTPPKVVTGYDECETNGITVTYDNFSCDFPPPPTCYNMDNEILDPNINECVCLDGYHRNSYGSCWKDLDQNATQDQIDQDQQDQQDQAKEDRKNELDLNSSNDILNQNLQQNDKLDRLIQEVNSTNLNLNNLQNQLGGDLNRTNSLLSSINDNLDSNGSFEVASIDSELQASNDWIDSIKTQYNDFYSNVNTQLDNIQTNFNDTKNLFSTEKTFSVPGGSTANCIDFNFHGKQITFDLCTPLQQFAPIVYFVFVLLFMIGTFRFTVTHLLKGLE